MPKSMNHNFRLSDRAAAAPVGTMGGAPEAEVDDHTKTARRATRATIKKKVRKNIEKHEKTINYCKYHCVHELLHV